MSIDGNISSSLCERFSIVKKNLFDKYYAELNDRQREAVYDVNGPLLILAGAGSGKTTVLVRRIAHIIKFGNAYYDNPPRDITVNDVERLENALTLSDNDEISAVLGDYASQPCPAWAILSITFTNKAANEMKERLAAAVGNSANEIWAGTFHSIALRILRRFGDRLGYMPGFTIYDTDDTKRVISACLKQLNIDEKMLPAKSVATQISRAKDKLMTAEDYETSAGSDFKLCQIASVYKAYRDKLLESNVMDFDDIIMQTVMLLKNDADARDFCQHRFKYVCVDEYQDTNLAQFELIKLLSGFYRNLMVVGDDDQSIYKFRGATIENILNFERSIEGAKVVKLEQNYRSTQNILKAANSVIRNNEKRRGKELWTSNTEGEKLRIKKLENQTEEAKYIINKIMELVIREKRGYSDFAILYRVNAQSNSLEQVFARSGIAYRILGSMRFYERKEIKDILAYLCVVNNTADNLRLRRIINEPKRKIGEATVNAVEQLAVINGVSMFEIMKKADKYTIISKSSGKLIEFTYLIEKLQNIAEKEPLPDLIEKTIDMSGYRSMLISEGAESEDRLENIAELISNAVEYVKTHEETTLNGFLEETALISDIDNYDEKADAVTLMTIHSAKGLEFPIIFLPGMEDGLFPGSQSVMFPEDLEEERRLAYVAITRAKCRLFCTHVRERLIYGRTQYNQPSRFISEIQEDLIETDQPKKHKAEENAKDHPKKMTVSKEFLKKSDLTKRAGRSLGYERFTVGDTVAHMTFGQGEILSAVDVGSDVMYEIAFENVGTKKLMATYAKLKRV